MQKPSLMYKNALIFLLSVLVLAFAIACQKQEPAVELDAASQTAQGADTENLGDVPNDGTKIDEEPVQAPEVEPSEAEKVVQAAELKAEQLQYDEALRLLYDYECSHPTDPLIDTKYLELLYRHPDLNAEARLLVANVDVSAIKKLGGGSTLVYRLLKGKDTIAAFKPRQERHQSNHRSEIAAYRLCPRIKCGFNVPINYPVYFDYQQFSGLYARIATNPKSEFKEITPTRLPDKSARVEGTFKEWIPDFADFPIEFYSIWTPWLDGTTTREELLKTPATSILERIEKRHVHGQKTAQGLLKHFGELSTYGLAKQISNLLVFDFLINNWDRFSGVKSFYGVNCQFANGAFMSIDNGAAFPVTPQAKPDKWLKSIRRFSRATHRAILELEADQQRVNDYLFLDPSPVEVKRLETFWNQRELYLDYVQECIDKYGESETLFFE